jgi:glyoxylase-like metal-dependent hydrolase (beta-lactamase superfamily II)
MKLLRNNIGVFTGQGGTIAYLLSKTGTVVVDAEFPDPAKHLIAALQQQSAHPFRLLINTHHHLDHTSGNICFKGLTEHVLAHANSKANQEKIAITQKKEDQQLYPDQTFTDTWTSTIDSENISLPYHGPGHTNGDSLVHFEHAGIVHMGDLVFNRRHPFIDRSAGANISNWITILDKALKKFSRKTIFIFGHTESGYDVTGNASDIVAFRDYPGNLLRFTDARLKSGKSKEEILKATEIPGSPEWRGDGIQRSLTAAYEELTSGK